jgi:hypothetical protein
MAGGGDVSQHLDALALANEIRLAQAAVLREIRSANGTAGDLAAEALRNPTDTVGSIRLERLLRALPRMGPRYADKTLAEVGMSRGRLSRRVRELTERERHVLADALVARSARSRAKGAA